MDADSLVPVGRLLAGDASARQPRSARLPAQPWMGIASAPGAPNEIWSYGGMRGTDRLLALRENSNYIESADGGNP